MAGGRVSGCVGSVAERFWRKVDKSPHPKGCWVWKPNKGREVAGYLGISRQNNIIELGPKQKTIRASKLSYVLNKGPITDGLHVLHTCDNPSCVNPDHLWLGTHQQNMADRDKKLRLAYGERMGPAKLTVDQVRAIRLEYQRWNRSASLRKIAAKYGVDGKTIHAIVSGRTWRLGQLAESAGTLPT